MSKDKPLISVVMPTWNHSNLIANAINSIRNQTIEDFELIIIEDGSDYYNALRNEQIIAHFGDPRIKYFKRSHEGLAAARNFGNSQAKADVIAIQDDDDLSLPNRFEKCLKAIEKVDVVVHGAMINMWDNQFQCISRTYLPPGSLDKAKLAEGQCLTGWPVFKKSVWEKKPFRSETQFCYDWMMHLDWIYSGFKYKLLDEILYEYVRHENSASIIFEKDGRRQQSENEIKRIIKEYEKA